jgi:hypothetical protein
MIDTLLTPQNFQKHQHVLSHYHGNGTLGYFTILTALLYIDILNIKETEANDLKDTFLFLNKRHKQIREIVHAHSFYLSLKAK